MDNFILSSTTLIGTDVKNIKGENLGTVKDIALDVDSGKIAYLVLAFGGFLSIGNKYFAIPLQALAIDPVDERLILNVTKERLESAPGFDRDNMPDRPQREFLDEVYTFYGLGKYSHRSLKEKATAFSSSNYENPDLKNEFNNPMEDHFNSEDINTRNRNFDPDINNSLF